MVSNESSGVDMNIPEELHKVFPIPQRSIIEFLDDDSEPVEDRLLAAEAHARFAQHLKECANISIARHKNIDSNGDIMAAIMAHDHQALFNPQNQI